MRLMPFRYNFLRKARGPLFDTLISQEYIVPNFDEYWAIASEDDSKSPSMIFAILLLYPVGYWVFIRTYFTQGNFVSKLSEIVSVVLEQKMKM